MLTRFVRNQLIIFTIASIVGVAAMVFVYMQGTFDEVMERLSHRQGHFMKPSMLQSQSDILEEPGDDEIHVNVHIGQADPEHEAMAVAGASGDVGQADAQRYPRLGLSGNIFRTRLDAPQFDLTSTTWNIGPRDGKDVLGPIEKALVGSPIVDPEDPVELGHVARSFDSCLVCTVHAYDGKTGKELSKFIINGMV